MNETWNRLGGSPVIMSMTASFVTSLFPKLSNDCEHMAKQKINHPIHRVISKSAFHADGITRSAVFSQCETWRYTLERDWVGLLGKRNILFILLNPSTADETQDDPTNRRALNFARQWRFTSCTFANLFAIRSPDPRILRKVDDPVGPDNDYWIDLCAAKAHTIVCAWGAHGTFMERAPRVQLRLAARYKLYHMGLTKGGEPRHILYLPNDTPLQVL